MKNSILTLLEELRAIAQTGLNFSKDEYDIKRYNRLIELAAMEYSDLSGIDEKTIKEAFLNDIAYATPKVGVEGAIFKDNKILLVQRSDNKKWCLPCGWCEVTEAPRTSVAREVFEETGLTVTPETIIDVLNVFSGDYNQPHSYYQILFYCSYKSGDLKTSDETIDLGFFDLNEINDWHRNHYLIAEKAMEYYMSIK